MKIVEQSKPSAPDKSFRWVTWGLVVLTVLGIVTVFGGSLWSMVVGEVSIQNP